MSDDHVTPVDAGYRAGPDHKWFSSFLRQRDGLLAAALLALHGTLAWYGRAVGIGTGNDDASYLLLSRSIADLAYRDSYLLGAPVHSQYPPGFPALLALFSLPFGERFGLLLLGMIAVSVTALAVVYVTVRACSGRQVALLVLALCAVNPTLVQHAGFLSSEVPYTLFTAITVWAVLREPVRLPEACVSHAWPILASAAVIASALTRVIGVTMVAALLLYWLWERRYRRVLVLSSIGAMTVGGWLVSAALAPAQFVGRSYFADATYTQAQDAPILATLVQRAARNVPNYLSVDLPWVVTQGTIRGTVVDNAVGLVVTVVLGAAGVWAMWKQARLVVLYLAFSGALLAFWPWEQPRFLVPLLPFLLWVGMVGAFLVASRRRWLGSLPVVLAVIIGSVGLMRDFSLLSARSRCDRSAPATSAGCYSEGERAFFAAAQFIRTSTADTAIVLTSSEATFAYVSSRKVVMHEAFDDRDPTRMLTLLRSQGVDYVVLTSMRFAWQQHVRALREVCGELELVEEFFPITFVLRITSPGSSPGTNGCEAIQRFEQDHAKWLTT